MMWKIALPLVGLGMLASAGPAMATPFVGGTMTVTFDFCPAGWALMDGSTLFIADNEVLFSLIGTIYGGDGQDTFALPNAPAEYLADGTQLRSCIALFGIFPS